MNEVAIAYSDDSQMTPDVQAVARDVAKILTPNEEILYVAIQGGPLSIGQQKDAAVATTNRLIIVRRHVLGRLDLTDFQWQDIQDVSIKQGMTASDVIINAIDGRTDTLMTVEKDQAQRLYGISQQTEQEWREKRRVRTMEEERARAGGITMSMPGQGYSQQTPGSTDPSGDDQVARLAKAKAMLDQGLISEDEYQALKAKILGSI